MVIRLSGCSSIQATPNNGIGDEDDEDCAQDSDYKSCLLLNPFFNTLCAKKLLYRLCVVLKINYFEFKDMTVVMKTVVQMRTTKTMEKMSPIKKVVKTITAITDDQDNIISVEDHL